MGLRHFKRWKGGEARGLAVMSVVLSALLHPECGGPVDALAASGITRDTPGVGSWTSFRGPGANGHVVNGNPALAWDVEEGRNILWKTKVPKPGMNSPVVWEDRVFLTGADHLSRQVYCFQTATGKLLWKHDVVGIPGSPSNDELPNVLEETGLAAPTLTTNGRLVAAIFATGDLVCLNMEGRRVWAKNLGVPKNHYGHASSLISHERLLFVQYDQKEDSRLLALDLASGELAWEVGRGAISWSSPILVENNGRMELILTNSKAVDSYDPNTGKLLWHVECLDGELAPSAAYAGGLVFVANEYASGSAIAVGNHDSEPRVLWSWEEVLPDAASLLANDQYLIVPTGYGVVDCRDVSTGRVLWEHEFDVGFYSTPILANDRVYLADVSGAVQVFRMADEFELLGTSELKEDVYATPAFVGERIYIRGLTHLFCIEARD
jgi:outer membrane protein assembly factor BamB